MTPEILDYRPDLLESAAKLRASVWGGSAELNLDYLRWKYERNPYLAEPVAQFALAEGRVVGMRASVGTCWEIPGAARSSVSVIPHGAEALVAPELRKQGVFHAMIVRARETHRERGFSHTITLSANAVSARVLEREGWRQIGTFAMLERRGRSAWLSRARVVRKARLVLSTESPRAFASLEGLASDGVTVSARPRPSAMVELCRRRPAPTRLRHVRDEPYFEWRFENPLSQYRFLYLGGDPLEAYAVVQRRGRESMVNIVDWEATSVSALRKLLDAIGRGGFDCVRVWGSTVDSETVGCLADAGFVPASSDARARESFLLRPIADAGSTGWRIGGMQADSLESWGLRMIDSDAY